MKTTPVTLTEVRMVAQQIRITDPLLDSFGRIDLTRGKAECPDSNQGHRHYWLDDGTLVVVYKGGDGFFTGFIQPDPNAPAHGTHNVPLVGHHTDANGCPMCNRVIFQPGQVKRWGFRKYRGVSGIAIVAKLLSDKIVWVDGNEQDDGNKVALAFYTSDCKRPRLRSSDNDHHTEWGA